MVSSGHVAFYPAFAQIEGRGDQWNKPPCIISDLKSSDDAGAGSGDDGGGDVDAGGKTLHLGQLVWIAVYLSQLDQSRGQLFKKMIIKRKDRMTSEAGSRSQECENIVFVKENLPWLHF